MERSSESSRDRMDMANPSVNSNRSQKRSKKSLFYDPRYGLVYDVWKDPSEEALSGGRGMFCIVPLANALVKSASNTINHLASSTLKVLENPDLFKPEELQANISSQLKSVSASLKKPQFDLAMLMRSQPPSSCSLDESRNREVS